MRVNKLITSLFILLSTLISKTLSAQDWAQLKFYQKKNALLDLPKPGEKRVVFYGNSITQHWEEVSPDFFPENGYIDRGISGQTTPQMLIRFRQDVIDLKPAVMVLLAGTNDLAGNTGPSTLKMITDNIFSMAELAQVHQIKVILSSILPVYDYPWKKGVYPSQKIEELNKTIKNYCKKHKLIYLDYYTPMVDQRKGLKKDLSEDGVHPNKKGYQVMEPLVKKAIAKALIN
ncbi:MAG: acylhydrolase [Flavobacteriia bacterium]|nr:MAG: acylhydrolase [Flavobacteriia bacterium]